MGVGDRTRVIVKNLPPNLDSKGIEKLILQKCKDLGLVCCDCKLLTKKKRDHKTTVEVSRRLCFVGFLNDTDATKFLEHYDGSYFRTYKVNIEYSRPIPKTEVSKPQSSSGNKTLTVTQVSAPRKAGVSNKRKHILYDDTDDTNVEYNAVSIDKLDSNADQSENSTSIEDASRVIIFNLPYNITEGAIREFCKPFGPIKDIHLPMNTQFTLQDLHGSANNEDPTEDKDSTNLQIKPASQDVSKMTKGYCYVTWMFPSDAVKFKDAKNRSIFSGRIIHVDIAKPKVKPELDFTDRIKRKSYKKEAIKKKKEDAENVGIWNTLHIDINATIGSVSKQLNIEKGDILDESSAAVNVTLTEAYVTSKLTEWLVSQGINYEQYETKGTFCRSDDTIIIKNLPPNTVEIELLEMFRQFGKLIRFSLSPFMVMGIAQFYDSKSANTAFKNLAYKSYLSLPLYLEWAPIGMFHPDATIDDSLLNVTISDSKPEESSEPKEIPEAVVQEEQRKDTPEESILHTSVYLKNLDFKTRDEDLHSHFSSYPGYISSKVVIRDGLSMGFGFIEFDSLEHAKAAIMKASGKLICGRLLEMSISKQEKKEVVKLKKQVIATASTKIIVKNLAFQATKSEIHKLFSFYGNIKSVRIPKSVKNQHRGFAFVDFMTKQEAIHAMEALQHSHFYGRHLVLEFAEQEED
ncbi:hypothetical protein BEWA_009200 [Theileria equi strain WA]|uniref:RRM domain-containing protein n=1 Tax=Theileria equi strain WA TaxID=1537102 RepID=L0B1Z7_THEEQ|nr:hypothetical protein BEWA_009200 [Theileria equi strain WA]AFZ81508.1 hypothetical protein BEWA_009200 [Theileria equi strain WA]|eukprot:XP_004831174.1 hypothetical protein BEWA_009200 [Theileria equi strain WA]